MRVLFGAAAQVVVGVVCLIIGAAFWVLGTFKIPGALGWPWDWSPVGYVFHASMFFGEVACFAIVSNGLTYRSTERVEQIVAQDVDVEHADEVNIER